MLWRTAPEGITLPQAVWLAVIVCGAALGVLISGDFSFSTSTVEWVLMCTAGLAALAVAVQSPFLAFCVLVVTLPFENALVFTSVFTVTPSYIALLLIFTMCAVFAPRRRIVGRIHSPLHKFVLVYLGISVFSIVMTIVAPPPLVSTGSTGWRATELRSVIQVMFLLFTATSYFATVYFCSTAARLKLVLTIHMATAALVALYGIYQVIAAVYYLPMVARIVQTLFGMSGSFRPNATFREPLNFGHYLLTALPVAITLFLHRERLRAPDRVVFGVGIIPVIAVMTAALVATIARGAWIGFVASLGIIALISGRKTIRAMPLAAVIGAVALLIARQAYPSWYDMYAMMADRFNFTSPINVAAEQRLPFMPFLFGLAGDHLLLGVGYGNYPLYQMERFGGGIAGAYALYFQALVESGVLGLSALLGLITAYYYIVWTTLRRYRDSEWWPWLAGSMASFTGLLIQYFTFGDRFSVYMWVFLGSSMAIVNILDSGRQTPS